MKTNGLSLSVLLAVLLSMATLLAPSDLRAETLRFAIASEPTSIDPLFQGLLTNDALASHIFGVLVRKTDAIQYVPDLAVSWKLINDTTWEFKLRQGVKFHD